MDAVDEAFSRAMAAWSRVSVMESPGGWVRMVAFNAWRRTARRRGLEARLLRRSRTSADVELGTADPAVWRAVADLPRRQREVIALRYIADCTESETAAVLGISEGAASASLVTARRRLAEVLRDDSEVASQ